MPIPQLTKTHKFLAKCIISQRCFWDFCKTKAPEFYNEDTTYLKEICEAIEAFIINDDELLVINMPPRHGKSRTAVNAVQWLLGNNKHYKIMTCSYNEKLSRKFSRQTLNGIKEQSRLNKVVFCDIFKNVKIKRGSGSVDLWAIDGNDEENYLATSPNATTTGIGADFIIIDDLVKNSYEAHNSNILENHYEWFKKTLYTRLEGKRKIFLFMTRWATKDLAGRLIEKYKEKGRKIKVISKKAYENGIMLNEKILNKKQYDGIVDMVGEEIVKANFDQEPIDIKGVLYDYLLTYTEVPQFMNIYSYCDTADTGLDYLCNIIYGKTSSNKAYILDVYYTQDKMEITEKETAKRLTDYNVEIWNVESNNGGRGFARAVETLYHSSGNDTTICRWYNQSLNKESRILANSTSVMKNILFPEQWNKMYPQFYREVTSYQRKGKNMHDDGVDVLSEIANSLVSITAIQFG